MTTGQNDPEESPLLDAAVTLPDGRAAVVHTETIGSGGPVVTDQERAELTDTVRHNFAFSAVQPYACDTVRSTSPELVITAEAGRTLWFDLNVLCTEPRCRAEAELGEEHPAAYRLRGWGQSADLSRAVWR
ncbi:hypothetical protein SUDANB58_05788 (plasmid) [Streptomyces sp. enrichment culture]|uniref:hypothetical protein n=1 Tax=Streptomyces sp. enrichment culture TaxID=1795815 RepID=UPI003F57E0D0